MSDAKQLEDLAIAMERASELSKTLASELRWVVGENSKYLYFEQVLEMLSKSIEISTRAEAIAQRIRELVVRK